MNSNLTKRDGIKRQGFLTRHLRWLSPSLVALVVAVMFGAYAPVAKADSYDFTLTDASHVLNFTFSAPSTITPTSYSEGNYFQFDPTSLKLDGLALPGVPVSFWNIYDGGGLIVGDVSSITPILNQGSDVQLYTGDESAPTGFVLGTFALTDWGGALLGGNDNFTLTITDPPGLTDVPTPEPSSLLLLGVGLLGMTGLIAYQQKRNGALLTEAKSPSGGVAIG